MLKAKTCGRRSVKDKKTNWTLKTKIKSGRTNVQVKILAGARIRTLEHHARFLDALPSQVFTCANQW